MATTNKQAKKYAGIAVDCIAKEMQKHAFDANRFKSGVSHDPHAKRSHDRYVELADAMKFFEEVKAGAVTLPLF